MNEILLGYNSIVIEDNLRAGCSVAIYAHTRNVAGHVWMSITDEQANTRFYGVAQANRRNNSQRNSDSGFQHTLEATKILIHEIIGDLELRFGQIRARDDYEVMFTIPIDSEQHKIIIEATDKVSKEPKKYQILGIGNNKENCITTLERILAEAGIHLDQHIPATTWIEQIKSPHSLVLRTEKTFPAGETRPLQERKPALLWVTEVLNMAETGIRSVVKQ